MKASLPSHTVTVFLSKLLKLFNCLIEQTQLMASQMKRHKYCSYCISDNYAVVLHINVDYKHCILYRCFLTVKSPVQQVSCCCHSVTSNRLKCRRFLLQQLSLVTDLIRFVSHREFLLAFSRSARSLLAWPVFLGRHGEHVSM